jgi:hypothetical protein
MAQFAVGPPFTGRTLIGIDPRIGMQELLQRAKLRVLFEAHELGRREPSAATAGTLLYAAAMMPGILDEELQPYFTEVESLIDSAGTVQVPLAYRTTVETNWSDAWCLAAAMKRPQLMSEDKLALMAASLLERQEPSGGWSLRPDRPGRPDPFFSLPIALALRELRKRDLCEPRLVRAAIAGLTMYLKSPFTGPVLVHLLRHAQLNLLGAEVESGELERLHEEVWHSGELNMESVEIGREDQPLWYTRIDRSLMVLAARRLWPILDPVNVRLAGELLHQFDVGQRGWRNHDTDIAICTWRTAEAFLAVDLIAGDLRRAGVTHEVWRSRREVSHALRSTDGFDVGICFSSSQRQIAAIIRRELRDAGLTVFYDEDYQHELLGADLNVYLHDTYFRRCRYAVAILSHDFIHSNWSGSLEWRAILTKLQEVRGNFLLPYNVDEVEIPGLSPSIGYLSKTTHSPEDFAKVVVRKVLTQRSVRG